MASPNATTSLNSNDSNDDFWIGPKGQAIPWGACILALELENMGYRLGRGLEPDSLKLSAIDGATTLSPEIRQRVKDQKHHLLQVVAVALL